MRNLINQNKAEAIAIAVLAADTAAAAAEAAPNTTISPSMLNSWSTKRYP